MTVARLDGSTMEQRRAKVVFIDGAGCEYLVGLDEMGRRAAMFIPATFKLAMRLFNHTHAHLYHQM